MDRGEPVPRLDQKPHLHTLDSYRTKLKETYPSPLQQASLDLITQSLELGIAGKLILQANELLTPDDTHIRTFFEYDSIDMATQRYQRFMKEKEYDPNSLNNKYDVLRLKEDVWKQFDDQVSRFTDLAAQTQAIQPQKNEVLRGILERIGTSRAIDTDTLESILPQTFAMDVFPGLGIDYHVIHEIDALIDKAYHTETYWKKLQDRKEEKKSRIPIQRMLAFEHDIKGMVTRFPEIRFFGTTTLQEITATESLLESARQEQDIAKIREYEKSLKVLHEMSGARPYMTVVLEGTDDERKKQAVAQMDEYAKVHMGTKLAVPYAMDTPVSQRYDIERMMREMEAIKNNNLLLHSSLKTGEPMVFMFPLLDTPQPGGQGKDRPHLN